MSIIPWDNLQDYVHDWMKGLQLIVDEIAPDPDEDNSMLPLASLPYKFDGTFYCTATTNDLIDGYDAWDKGYGYQPWLIGYRLNLTNNVLRVVNQSFMGKCAMSPPDRWGWLNNEDIATIEAAGREVYSQPIEIVNNYSTNTIKVVGGTYGDISFKPLLHEITDIQIKYPMKNDTWETRGNSLVGATTAELPEYNENTGFYDSPYYADYQVIGHQPNYSVYSNLIAVFDSVQEAEYIVGTLSPYNTNNDVINYTKTGSEYKLYYGDHYLIYALDDSKIYNYHDLFTGTKQATDRINNWNPSAPPIKTPTYDEVKKEDIPDEDESDDQESGGIYLGAQGMCNLYYMTKDEIKNLQNWFRGSTFSPGIQIPPNFDPSNQLIGLMAFPIELGGDVENTTITFRTSDNQVVDTGVSCQGAWGDDLKFDMGTIDIPARMKQRGIPFLDYSCQVEVYIPFCDVVQLDVQQVIGTTLKCEMWISPATGDVSAMLSSGTHPVAYTSGNCAQQLPISVSSYGAIAGANLAAQNRNTQAVFQAAQNVVKDITNTGAISSAISNHTAVNGQGLVEFSRIPQVQSNTGLAVGAGIKAAGTMVNTALQLTAQNFDNRYALSVAKNSAPTHVSGSFGACTSWHFPNYCYVKITRPRFQKPDNYGHTEAVPVVATKQLSELTGLTTCVNPDVSGIGTATMQELETIKGFLMSGVIL